MNVDKEYALDVLKQILAIDSPTGFTHTLADKVVELAQQMGYKAEKENHGNIVIHIDGHSSAQTVGACAHGDTLGLMVRSIKSNGMLAVKVLGGPIVATLDGEYCKIYTRDGRVYTGTILCTSPAVHVHKDARTKPREEENMEIRLDLPVHSKEDVLGYGINTGDFICYDPKTVITENGFIKSRFLDDKLSVAILFGALKHFYDTGEKPRFNTKFIVTIAEEVGWGMAHLPCRMDELIGVDMGCIGEDLNCTEYDVSICAADSGGAYDYELTTRLINLAKENNLKYAVDIYPYYGSDVGIARRAGHDVRGALIGAGVHASHGMERSTVEGMENTVKLLVAYLTK